MKKISVFFIPRPWPKKQSYKDAFGVFLSFLHPSVVGFVNSCLSAFEIQHSYPGAEVFSQKINIKEKEFDDEKGHERFLAFQAANQNFPYKKRWGPSTRPTC